MQQGFECTLITYKAQSDQGCTFFTMSIRIRSALLVRLHPREAKKGQMVSNAEPKSLAVLNDIFNHYYIGILFHLCN